MIHLGIGFFVVELILSSILTSYLLYYYADWKQISGKYLVLTWLGWFFSISIVFVIPTDVSSTAYDTCLLQNQADCSEPWFYLSFEFRQVLWNILYWTTYVLCWTGYPILQVYSTAGDFTAMEKFREAIKSNLIFYLVAGIVGGIFIIWVAVRSEGFEGIIGVAIAAANAWGLFLLIAFLGYGLAEIPRLLWKRGDREGWLRYNQFIVVGLKEGFEDAKHELDTTLKLVKKCSEKIEERDPFRPYINTIIEKCPPAYRDVLFGEGDFNFSYDELVQLNVGVANAIQEYRRSRVLYDMKLKAIFEVQDILDAKENGDPVIEWSFRKPRTGRFADQINRLERNWKFYAEPIFFRLLALLAGLFSLVVIWSELVFNFSEKIDLSIFSLVVNSAEEKPNLQWFLVFFSVSYIALSAYWALMQLKLFNFFRLIPHQQSDAYSLLFSAAYLCRLIAPLAYNFLLMIQDGNGEDTFCSGDDCQKADTAFYSVLGNIELAPFLGTGFVYYFPAVLVILVIFVAFDVYKRVVGLCCPFERCQKYVFLDEMSESRIREGKEILMKEREARKKGIHATKRDMREKLPVLPVVWQKITSLFGKEQVPQPSYGLLTDDDDDL